MSQRFQRFRTAFLRQMTRELLMSTSSLPYHELMATSDNTTAGVTTVLPGSTTTAHLTPSSGVWKNVVHAVVRVRVQDPGTGGSSSTVTAEIFEKVDAGAFARVTGDTFRMVTVGGAVDNTHEVSGDITLMYSATAIAGSTYTYRIQTSVSGVPAGDLVANAGLQQVHNLEYEQRRTI